MNKCLSCKSDTIYLGKGEISPLHHVIGSTYNYICANCGSISWSTEKEKSKYKWYKYPKEKLRKLLERNGIK